MSVIPTIQKAEIGRIAVQGQTRQKVCETPSQAIKLGTMSCTCHPRYAEGINKRFAVQAGSDSNVRPYSERQLKQEGLGGMAQP
jgi:hypothetical protein